MESLAILVAGIGAGAINATVGSGTLITFPVLLATGYAPVTANIANAIGLAPGSIAGAFGYRRELAGQSSVIIRLGLASLVGSVIGAGALIVMPPSAFETVAPVLVAMSLVLVIVQPRLNRGSTSGRSQVRRPGVPMLVAVLGTGIYGGYFGAAQGILLLGVLLLMLPEDVQRLNGTKNCLVGLVNVAAGAIFVIGADVAWDAVALIAAGSIVGGLVGASFARRLSPSAFRAAIVVVGAVAIIQLLVG